MALESPNPGHLYGARPRACACVFGEVTASHLTIPFLGIYPQGRIQNEEQSLRMFTAVVFISVKTLEIRRDK